jgi:hypothetical protein
VLSLRGGLRTIFNSLYALLSQENTNLDHLDIDFNEVADFFNVRHGLQCHFTVCWPFYCLLVSRFIVLTIIGVRSVSLVRAGAITVSISKRCRSQQCFTALSQIFHERW